MNISMSMVESYLNRYDIESDIQDDSLSIRGVRFLSEGRRLSSREYIYIGQALDYLKDPRYSDALILANGKNHIVCRGADREELINEALSAFDFYNHIDEQLLHAAADHRPLEEMLDVLEEALDDPFLVFDIEGSIVGARNLDKLPRESALAGVKERGNLGAEAIGGYYTNETGDVMHDLGDEAGISYGPDNEIVVARYFSQQGERVGFVMCFARSEGSAKLALCLETAFVPHLAQAHEFTDALSPHQSQHRALASLVEGEEVPDAAIAKILATVGGENDLYLVLAYGLAVRNRTQRLLLANEIEASNVACLACELGEFVAFLVSQPHVDALVEQIQQRFDPKSVSIGVSMPLADVRQAPRAYRQASFACESAAGPGVRFSRDLALPFMLQVLDNEPAAHDLLHPALAHLADYDAETGSELLVTLKAYIESGCNQVECARRLHVHLNTLKYRLKRMGELADLDFKDPEELFYLQLSLKLA